MKISEMLQRCQYSRITVGYRWMYASGENMWKVVERKRNARKTITILETTSEDLAVQCLIEGEELYSDVLKEFPVLCEVFGCDKKALNTDETGNCLCEKHGKFI